MKFVIHLDASHCLSLYYKCEQPAYVYHCSSSHDLHDSHVEFHNWDTLIPDFTVWTNTLL